MTDEFGLAAKRPDRCGNGTKLSCEFGLDTLHLLIGPVRLPKVARGFEEVSSDSPGLALVDAQDCDWLGIHDSRLTVELSGAHADV